MEETPRESATNQKVPLEALTKDELINKCKSLLTIAKKAKQAKDTISAENRKLKDALDANEAEKSEDRAALETIKETLAEFTQNKLILTTELTEARRDSRNAAERQAELQIQNESLERQLRRLTEENELLLKDLDHAETKLQQVNILSAEQKRNFEQLEVEISRLRALENKAVELEELKRLIAEQRMKYSTLKTRFIDVQGQLKGLRQCRKMLLDTHHEYAATVTKWQRDISRASEELCKRLNVLQRENAELKGAQPSASFDRLANGALAEQMLELELVAREALAEHSELKANWQQLKEQYDDMQQKLAAQTEIDSGFRTPEEEPSKADGQFKEELKSLIVKHTNLTSNHEELIMRLKTKESEHTEVLGEMRELNEALKQRGDYISKLQQKNDELNAELKKSAGKQAALQQAVEEMRGKLRELELEMQSACSQETDAQNDTLSISTTDNYEQKYDKLISIAAKLKTRLQGRTADLNAAKQAQAELLAENKKLMSTRKQANVLSLEIEAAEKSLADASAKLGVKIYELDAAKEQLACKESAIEQLRKELALIEAAKEAEVQHARQLKDQIDRLQTQVKDAVHNQQQVQLQNKAYEETIEACRSELAELRAHDLAKISGLEAELTNAITRHDALTSRLRETEQSVARLESQLANTKRAAEELRTEFADYKVKAQLVLKKNQSKETAKERELEAELAQLKASEQALQELVQSQSAADEQLRKHNELLQEDKLCLQQRNSELLRLVEETRALLEANKEDSHAKLSALDVTLNSQRHQLEEMEACHKMRLEQLNAQLEQAKAELQVKRMPLPSQPVNELYSNGELNGRLEAALLLSEREAAEGSEEVADSFANLAANRKISSASRRSQDFMPLSELLSTPLANMSDSVIHIGHTDLADGSEPSSEDVELALQLTREQLAKQESRVRHLTALLAENEQDSAKLTQLNDMLKEELRRQERSHEREKHMHNSEYVKNVFLKFLTLNNVDERTRLVPVLNTILKLSPSEAEMLNAAAKGQKVAGDLNQRSWGSLLSSWTGGGGVNNN